MASLLELNASRDGVWDEVSVAAMRTVAQEMARRVAQVERVRRRLRGLEQGVDVRACVSALAPVDSDGIPAALGMLLQRTTLTAGQRRYLAAMYASDPSLRDAIDDIADFTRPRY